MSMSIPRRLPSRKRPRSDGVSTEDQDVVPVHVPAPPVLTQVTPDLIAEVIQNGTVAPHVASLYRAPHDPSHRPKTGWLRPARYTHPPGSMQVEAEVGCLLLPVPALRSGPRPRPALRRRIPWASPRRQGHRLLRDPSCCARLRGPIPGISLPACLHFGRSAVTELCGYQPLPAARCAAPG